MDQRKLLRKIKNNFPKLTWKTVKNASNGYDHFALILDDRIIFRFPKNAYARNRFKGEVGLLNFIGIKLKPVLVPDYRYLPADKTFGGYKMIEGYPFSISSYKKLSAHHKKRLATEMAKFISTLHRIKPSLVSKYVLKGYARTKEFKRLYSKYRKSFYSLFSQDDQYKLEHFFSNLSKMLKEKHSKVFVHNDLFADNIYLNKANNLKGVIDFTDRAIDDPAVDFIRLWNYNDPGFVKMICQQYNKVQAEDILYRSHIYFLADTIWNMFSAIEKNKEKEQKWFYRKFKKFYASPQSKSSHQNFHKFQG